MHGSNSIESCQLASLSVFTQPPAITAFQVCKINDCFWLRNTHPVKQLCEVGSHAGNIG